MSYSGLTCGTPFTLAPTKGSSPHFLFSQRVFSPNGSFVSFLFEGLLLLQCLSHPLVGDSALRKPPQASIVNRMAFVPYSRSLHCSSMTLLRIHVRWHFSVCLSCFSLCLGSPTKSAFSPDRSFPTPSTVCHLPIP